MKKSGKFFLISLLTVSLLLMGAALVLDREKIELTDEVRDSGGNSFIKLSEGMTEYEIAGNENGTPVVLIHGLTVPMFDWDNQFDFLVSRGFRVLRYNQYGRGLSDRPSTDYNKDFYMKQLDELIEYFFEGKVSIIGHSFGGGLAAEYGARFSRKVDKMIFISPVLNVGRDNGGVTLIRIPLLGDYCAKTILSPILASRADSLFRTSPTGVFDQYNKAFDFQTRIKGFSSAVKSLFRNDATGDFSTSYSLLDGSKAFLMWGDQDSSVSYKDINEIKKLNSNISIKIYENVKHSPNLEIPDEINKQMLRFLNS